MRDAGDAAGETGGGDPAEALTAVSEADEQRVQDVTDADELRDLRRSTSTNRTVAVAVGVLMERFRQDLDQAFGRLVAVCQQAGRRLSDVSDELVATGTVAGAEVLAGSRARPGEPSACPAGDPSD